MSTYNKYLIKLFLMSLFYISSIILSLIFILSILTEIDFFKDTNVNLLYPIYLAFLNTPSLIFEMFPFIFLLTSQVFFVKLFKDNQIDIFKYSGLKNTSILKVITITSFILGLLIVIFFYNFSSNLKNFYLNLKSNYTKDNKYLAVITKNGLWIKDKIDNKVIIMNALEINGKFLKNNFISVFNENNQIVQNIKSPKIDIEKNIWKIYDAIIFKDNSKNHYDVLNFNSNFNFEKIQNLFSNLSSLSIIELFKLKNNYNNLGYSITEINMHILKILLSPLNLFLVVLFTSIIMLNFKSYKNNTFKIVFGLFLSVIIYYINNFFYIFGANERIPFYLSILTPLIILTTLNVLTLYKINEK